MVQDLLEIYQSSKSVGRLAELQELVQPTLEELAQTFSYERAFVALVDVDQRLLQGTVGINIPQDLIEQVSAHSEEPSPMVQALLLGRPLRVEDALRDATLQEDVRPYYVDFGMPSFAAIPLLPAASVLVVSKSHPISEAEINQLLPYAGRLVAMLAQRNEASRLRESGEQHAVENEWLWWMINASQDPIILSNQENAVLFYNMSAERLLKAQIDDSPGKRRAIELNNFLLSAAISSFHLDQGADMERELTLVDPIEGDELLFEVICKPATNLRSGAPGLISILKDVTDLRRATDELRRSLQELQQAEEAARIERDRLNLLLKNVADPIVVTDLFGNIILMNLPAQRLLQLPDDQPIGAKATSYLANDAKLSSFLSQLLLAGDRIRHNELQFVDPHSGEPLTMSVTATEVQDELGQVTAIVSVMHDLTRIRELEQRRVEQQLFESEKLAAVGRLAAAVAHEINNPLEGIKNALYLVTAGTPENAPNRKYLEIANKETERVSGVIRQMLGFYRPRMAKTATDLNLVITDVLALLERQFRQRNITLQLEIDPRLPSILAATDQLKQVFLNLFLNAQEAMPKGGTLDISTRLSRETDTEFLAGAYVMAQVRDTGSGISDEQLPHIFEPFYSTKTDSKGTGLGLWVSLGIVQNHGGQLTVRSRPGRGTTFTVAFPMESGQ